MTSAGEQNSDLTTDVADDPAQGVGRRSPLGGGSASFARSLVPAAAILLAQVVLFPAPSGIVLRGLVVGGLTALVAVGMALVYRANRILNFAQADLGLAPTVLAFLLIRESGVPWVLALVIGLVAAVALGAATDRLVIGRFARSPRLLVTVATLGLSQVLAGAALLLPRAWDLTLVAGRIEPPFDATRRIGGVTFDVNDLVALALVPAVLAAVALFLQRSDAGIAIRASADAPDRAALAGVPVRRLQTLVWAVAGGLAFFAVFARSGILDVPTGSALGFGILLRALAALLIGRMTNLVTIVSVAVALGALELGIAWDHDHGLIDPVLAVVVGLALVLRRRDDRRTEGDDDWQAGDEVRVLPASLRRLPAVRAVRWASVAVLAAAAVALPQVLAIDQQFKASALVIYAVLGLSLVLLSGWLGTVSLGHVAFFALGAAVAGNLIARSGVDLLVAMVAAAAVGAVAGVVVALPTLRLRGLYLAVTTFAFALATTSYLLDDDRFGWVPTERIERAPLLGGLEVASEEAVYYLASAVFVLVAIALRAVRRSRFGRVLVALRDNPRAAESYAVDARRVRLAAFALSGAVAGLAGSLFVHHERTLDPASYGPIENLVVLTMVVVGGMTSLTGALLGALFLFGTRWFLPTEWQFLATGLGVLIVLLLAPSGLAGLVYRARDGIVARLAPAAVPTAAGTGPGSSDDVPPPAEPVAGEPQDDGPGGQPAPALEVRRLQVGYGGAPVVVDVDLSVPAGDAVALLGTNGAGKSTLLRAISGVLSPTAGEVLLDGRPVGGLPAHRVAARGLAYMPGGAGVFPSLTVDENLRVAGWLRRHDRSAHTHAVDEVRTLFPVLAARGTSPAGDLSGGQQQMLALAMAVLTRPRVLMIDELSLGLAPAIVGELLAMVDRLRAEGMTLVIVEQSVDVALDVADRAVFLERGQVRFAGPARELLERPDLLRSVFLGEAARPVATAGAPGPGLPGAGDAAARDAAAVDRTAVDAAAVDRAAADGATAGDPALAAVELSVAFGGVHAVQGVSFAVAAHEIVGVIGPNGAGKTTLFDLLGGAVVPTSGRVVLAGRDVTHLGAAQRARRGLGRSFQDARLFPSLTVDEAIAVAYERWVAVGDPLSAAFHLPNAVGSEIAVERRVDELVDLLGLGEFRSSFVSELSTGTRRVVDLACLLAHQPSVVLLDEPAAGLAQREVEQLAPLIRRMRDETGASVVVVEHDVPLVAEVSDRLVAMDQGRVVAVGPPGHVLDDPAVVAAYLGDRRTPARRSGVPVT